MEVYQEKDLRDERVWKEIHEFQTLCLGSGELASCPLTNGCDRNVVVYRQDGKIIASMSVFMFETHSEVFDICTLYNEIKKLMLDYLPERPTWIALRINNPTFSQNLQIYTSLGFTNPVLVKQSPSNIIIGGVAVGLEYLPDTNVTTSEKMSTYYEGFQLKQHYDEVKDGCVQLYIISKSTIDTFKQFMEEPIEYGGHLNTVKRDDGKFEYEFGEIIKGDEFSFSVQIGCSNFSWHTHPRVCNRALRYCLAWPSGADMNYVYICNLNSYMSHIVVSDEGLYSIQVTLDFKRFMSSMNEEIALFIGNKITERFASVEEERSERNVDVQIETLRQYLFYANNTTLKHLDESLPEIILYTVTFITWNTIKETHDLGKDISIEEYVLPEDCKKLY